MLPDASMAKPPGRFRPAEAAGPLSPEEAGWPVPAIDVKRPSDPTRTMRLFEESAMYTVLSGATATATGVLSAACAAGSEVVVVPAAPVPAKVRTTASAPICQTL